MKLLTKKRASPLFRHEIRKYSKWERRLGAGKIKAGIKALKFAIKTMEDKNGKKYKLSFHQDNNNYGDGLHYINFGNHKNSCISFDTRTGIFRWISIDEVKSYCSFRFG